MQNIQSIKNTYSITECNQMRTCQGRTTVCTMEVGLVDGIQI